MNLDQLQRAWHGWGERVHQPGKIVGVTLSKKDFDEFWRTVQKQESILCITEADRKKPPEFMGASVHWDPDLVDGEILFAYDDGRVYFHARAKDATLENLDPAQVTEFDDETHGPITICSEARMFHLNSADVNLYYRMPKGKLGHWFVTISFQEEK